MYYSILTLLRCFFFLRLCFGSNILMVLPFGSLSHKNVFKPLAQKLSNRGHNVMLASMHEEPVLQANSYKEIVAKEMSKNATIITGDFNIFQMISDKGPEFVNAEMMRIVLKNFPSYCESFLLDPDIQPIWKFKPDLVLLPAFMNECGLIFVAKFRAPFIYVTTSGLFPWISDLVQNPENPSYIPNQFLPYTDIMDLFQRVVNTIFRYVSPYLRRKYILNSLHPIAEKFLNDSALSLVEIESNVSLILVNSHYSLGFPRPHQPNVIEVGGIHCREGSPIQDTKLKLFLDSSEKNSVILFSFGSHIQSSQMSDSMKKVFIKAFSKLPYKIVWKHEILEEDIPSNIFMGSWLPQQDILAHPATGGFFTHGGLLSLQESVFHGVPIVGLPLISDQHLNVVLAEKNGIAIKLSITELSEEKVISALTAIMEDDSYRKNIQEKSILLRDQLTRPVDRATFYTEYVIRNKGLPYRITSVSPDVSLIEYDLFKESAMAFLIFLGSYVLWYLGNKLF